MDEKRGGLNWEVFRKGARGQSGPAALIFYRGHTGGLGVNERAFEALGRPKGFVLLFARDQGLIGIRPSDPTKEDCYIANDNKGRTRGCQVSAKAFAKFYGIPPGTYPVKFVDGMLVAKLSDRRDTPGPAPGRGGTTA